MIVQHGSGPDGSEQFIMKSSSGGQVQFATLDEEMCAHTWMCPNEGREFLAALEEHAKNISKQLTVCTVLNPKLITILVENGYKMYIDVVELGGGYCEKYEVWSKEGHA